MLSLSKIIAQQSYCRLSQIIPRQLSTVGALYASFTTRDLISGSHEAGTLINRFVKHIALEKCRTDPLIPQKIKYSDFFPLSEVSSFQQYVRKIPSDQIPRLLIFTYTYKTNGDPQKVTQVLNIIDALCLQRIQEMNHDTLLSTLYSLMYLLPNKITKFEFYPKCIERLVTEMGEDCPKERFLETCFYLGLWKKHRRSCELMNLLRDQHLDRSVDQLTEMEFAIVTSALYKTSTVASSPVFTKRLIDEVLRNDASDDSLLITFVKSLRLNRQKSDQIFQKILGLKTTGKLERLSFKGLTHIFALLADGQYNDSQICTFFSQLCLDKLEATTSDDQYAANDLRAKDLSTFIWSCAALDCRKEISQYLDMLTELVFQKIKRDEYRYHPDDLIDTALSFWMLGHQSRDLIREVFSMSSLPKWGNADRVKLDSRLELLKSCVQIEQPNWMPGARKNQKKLFAEERPAPKYLIEKQPNLQNVSNMIKENDDELGVRSFKYVAPIHELNIASLLVEMDDGKKYFVEALEDDQLQRFGEKPVAIMALKLRLLESLGYSVIVIPPSMSSSQTLSTLKNSMSGTDDKLSIEKVVS